MNDAASAEHGPAMATALLARLEARLGTLPRPRVRALHLPPAPWDGSKDGEFGALELDDGSLGLSYVLLDDSLAALARGDGTQGLVGEDAFTVAQWWRDREGAERTLGFAAVNALSRHLFNRMGFVPPAARDSIAGLDPQPGEHVGMVGFFPPLVKQVTRSGARLTVLELRADLVGARPGFDVTLDPSALRTCNKLLCTSTALLNHTLGNVLTHCIQASRIALIGPGAGAWPETLFEMGITTLGGSWVDDAEGFKQALADGKPWSAFAHKFVLERSDWFGP
jgi:uncharacterized protein